MTDRILIEIATTEGPATVRAAEYDPDARLSSMVLYDQNHVPVGVDVHFDAFDRKLRKHLARLGYQTPPGGLILEVDRPIDAGSSWQLGLALTHAVAAKGLLTTSDRDATRVIWVTGAVGTSAWAAKGVEAVPRKLARAAARLRAFAARGVPVDVVVPLDNLAEAVNAAPDELTVRPASDLGALLGGVLPGTGPVLPRAPDRQGRRLLSRASMGATVGAVAALGIGVAIFAGPYAEEIWAGIWRSTLSDNADTAVRPLSHSDRAVSAAACTELLAPLATAERFDPSDFRTLADFYRLLNAPEEALKPYTSGIDPAAVYEACAPLSDLAETPEVREALLRRALYDIAAGTTEAAATQLAGLEDQGGDVLLATALASDRADRHAIIGAAAVKGNAFAEIADAVLLAARDRRRSAEALERLRSAAARPDGGGLANGLLAALLFVAAEVPPEGEALARRQADAALLEGVMRLAAARDRGFRFPVKAAQLAHISSRAPAMLGLALSELTEADATRLGLSGPGDGALVLVVGEADAGLAPGDAIRAVGRREVGTPAEAEAALFAAISAAVRAGGTIGLTVRRQADGRDQTVELALPAHLRALPLPQVLP